MQCMKKDLRTLIDVQNIKCILSDTYFCLNSIKIEKETVSSKKLTKKEEPMNLNLAGPNNVKNLAFPVSLCY